MNNLHFEHVLFSIDDWDNLRTSMRFDKYLDMKVAGGICKPILKGIGKYYGQYETCYLMDKRDFDKFVLGTPWVDKHICYALIPGDVRQPVVVLEFDTGDVYSSEGPMKSYDKEPSGDWTYMNGKYWSF